MFAKLLETLTGKDDIERVACKGDMARLNEYLKTHPIFVAQKPRRFLDAATLSSEQLLENLRKDMEELAGDQFDPWILEMDGKRRLPVFSGQARMEAFAAKISQEMNKVFGLSGISILLEDVTKQVEVDVIDLNLFSKVSWEFQVRGKR